MLGGLLLKGICGGQGIKTDCETKTTDNVFVTLSIAVQIQPMIGEQKDIYSCIYRLNAPFDQVRSAHGGFNVNLSTRSYGKHRTTSSKIVAPREMLLSCWHLVGYHAAHMYGQATTPIAR